jgi:LmbE family N-acetylglucosaminyl deacetylase
MRKLATLTAAVLSSLLLMVPSEAGAHGHRHHRKAHHAAKHHAHRAQVEGCEVPGEPTWAEWRVDMAGAGFTQEETAAIEMTPAEEGC